jgi:hypothetical protein
MSFNLQESFLKMNKGEVLLAYKGSVTSDLITHVLEAIEQKLDELQTPSPIKKKVYNVLVESLQNLYHHIDDPHDVVTEEFDAKFAMVVVSKQKETYRISTGNFVKSVKVKNLKEKLDKINSLTKEELKDLYKFVLYHQEISKKGGGGLGLIDIAKKTGHKLEYNFQSYTDDYYFFNLNVYVSW